MRALVRGVPDSFDAAIREHFGGGHIDVGLAREQHAAYCRALQVLGCDLVKLDPDPGFPDCCFVEDMAVVAGSTAMITHSGHPSRVGEREAVERALKAHLPVVRMPQDAHLDGGDVLVCGNVILVGLTARTDAAGVAFLDSVFGAEFDVRPVSMPGLHLKCVASRVRDGVIAATRGSLKHADLDGLRVVALPPEEAYAANFVVVGDRALVSDGFPLTARILEEQGLDVTSTPTTEFRKADGSLTCLSVLF